MNKQFPIRCLALVCALACLPVTALAQTEAPKLKNFDKVDQTLYRGGQPAAGDLKKLAAMGIKTVVDLRGGSRRAAREEAEARAAGLNYFHVPLPAWGRPADEQVARVLAIINEPENQPVFIHCRKGADRTGLIVACQRIARDGWDADRAMREADRYGMLWLSVWIKDYIGDFHARVAQGREVAGGGGGPFPPATEMNLIDRLGRGFAHLEKAESKGQQAVRWFFKRAAVKF